MEKIEPQAPTISEWEIQQIRERVISDIIRYRNDVPPYGLEIVAEPIVDYIINGKKN